MDWLWVCGPDANFSFLTLINVSQTGPRLLSFVLYLYFCHIYEVVTVFVLFWNRWLYKVIHVSYKHVWMPRNAWMSSKCVIFGEKYGPSTVEITRLTS